MDRYFPAIDIEVSGESRTLTASEITGSVRKMSLPEYGKLCQDFWLNLATGKCRRMADRTG